MLWDIFCKVVPKLMKNISKFYLSIWWGKSVTLITLKHIVKSCNGWRFMTCLLYTSLDSNIMRTRRKLLIVDETRDKIIWDLKCEIMSFDKIQNIFIADRIKRNIKSIERYVWILNTNFVNKYCQISEFGDLKWNDCTGEKEKWMRWV